MVPAYFVLSWPPHLPPLKQGSNANRQSTITIIAFFGVQTKEVKKVEKNRVVEVGPRYPIDCGRKAAINIDFSSHGPAPLGGTGGARGSRRCIRFVGSYRIPARWDITSR